MMPGRIITSFFVSLLVLVGSANLSSAEQAKTFYVAVNGSDKWSGTIADPNKAGTDGPFATLDRARDAVRKLKTANGELSFPVELLIRGGTYYFAKPFVLKPEDSGSSKCQITYRAYKNEKPVISGGRVLSGWDRYQGKIWRCKIAGNVCSSAPLTQLFYNDKPMELARYPNFDPNDRANGWMYTQKRPSGSPRSQMDTYLPVIRPGWDTARDGEIVLFMPDGLDWLTNVMPILRVDKEKKQVVFGDDSHKTLCSLSAGRRCYVRNVFEELDSPGEWYLDKKNSMLYFWPPDSRKPADGSVVMGYLDRLVETKGSAESFVGYISFSGLTFRHTTAHEQGGVECSPDGALRFTGARHCSVTNCRLLYLAGNAITITPDSREITVEGCEIAGAGSSGIYIPPGANYTTPGSTIAGHHIAGNEFYNCSRLHKGTGAIESWTVGGNIIEHNYMHDMPRWGVALVYCAEGENIVRYNEMRRMCLETGDCGAIHTSESGSHREKGNEISHNLLVDMPGFVTDAEGERDPSVYIWAVYLDENASAYNVHDNVIVGYQRGAIDVHGGHDNIFENNIFIGGTVAQTSLRIRDEKGTGNKIRCNIICPAKDAAVHFVEGISNWREMGSEMDYNLIFEPGSQVRTIFPGMHDDKDSWRDWTAMGYDKHSIIADPRFVDAANGDFHLRPDSPAFKLGFRQIDLSGVGLKGYGKR